MLAEQAIKEEEEAQIVQLIGFQWFQLLQMLPRASAGITTTGLVESDVGSGLVCAALLLWLIMNVDL